jgi:hypothetical protein
MKRIEIPDWLGGLIIGLIAFTLGVIVGIIVSNITH